MAYMPKMFRPAHMPTRQEQRQRYDRDRDQNAPHRKWMKTYRWQQLRARQLKAHPLCIKCEEDGLVSIATICDHKEPHRGDEQAFWDGPFQSLCKPHHDREKQREEQTSRPTRR